MWNRSAEEKQKQLERFLMNVAEAADAALWEYWREKEAEHRRFATEYVTRREKQKQLERFLMNVAEAADAALWEYWREKEAEHRRFATEYVTRRGLIPQQ